jgi:hypothetical protein
VARAVVWLRSNRTPRLWQELLLCGIGWYVYGLIRNAVPTHQVTATNRAEQVFAFEQTYHLDPEVWLNRTFTEHRWLVIPANYYYATLHFIVTLGVLVWLFRRHPAQYRAARTSLFVTCLIALVGFWLTPLAPPLMLADHGFVDTIVRFHTWGSWASGDVASASNQYAAMPSLHCAWALWSGLAIASLATRRWVQALGLLYPLTTITVVLGTANHYLLDVIGGIVTLTLGFAGQYAWSGHHAFEGAPPLATPTRARIPGTGSAA